MENKTYGDQTQRTQTDPTRWPNEQNPATLLAPESAPEHHKQYHTNLTNVTATVAEQQGSGTERYNEVDWDCGFAGDDDPYGIREEYITQSASPNAKLPTQADADRVNREAEIEMTRRRTETKVYRDGTSATGIAPLPNLSPQEQATVEVLSHQ